MEDVVLLRCNNYDAELIEKKLREGFRLLGGDAFLKKLIPEGSRVLLKPNMLAVEAAGSIVVTHYAVFEAVIRIIKDYAGEIWFGDSPGFGDPRKAAEKSGLMKVSEKYGVKYADFNESIHVTLEDSILCKSWDVAKAPYEADVVITLPRLKTHALAYFTASIKNQFGCVPGTQKALWHTKMPEIDNFAKMLLDLNTLVGTSFAILDGIVAMEGNGPKSGMPHELDTIIMGSSLSAVDSVAARIIGYDDPLETPILKNVYENNWGKVLPKDINILGEKLQDMKAKNFQLCRTGKDRQFINPVLARFVKSIAAPSPEIDIDKCIGCKRCCEVCPEKPNVITMVNKKGKTVPSWNYSKCIRCFCCQELCPKGAIETKYTPVGRFINRKR